ncbi:hypothetical protein PLIP_a2954 [Pseudoalteromonas lipolytica LMEB 39]|nr:hypothetical protein [Pseudoalteromonas lipolytica LMEB 39]
MSEIWIMKVYLHTTVLIAHIITRIVLGFAIVSNTELLG